MKQLFSLKNSSFLLIFSIILFACKKDLTLSDSTTTESIASANSKKSISSTQQGITFYALTGNRLDKFSTSDPENIINSATITGLQAGEKILGLDFRPATGQLYGLGSNSRIYTIDPSTGIASFVAALTTIRMGSTTAVPLFLSGSSFGFDFNPQVDRIRIVSNTGQNLRANPNTGLTLVDGSINPQPATVNGVAYDNNIAGTPSTELYALDISTDLQYEIKPPNNGTLVEPLPIKLDITGDGGFDIAPRNANVTTDIGLAIYDVNNKSTLFMIDVETGVTTILATYKRNNGNHFGNDKR